uniref:DUF659 domain-containing protein n=1 Tax=Magallana gigas TaxID=29159 RepID=A0A8W8JNA5_MAGGI
MYNRVKNDFQRSLMQAEQIAITTDGWTSRATESYLTVTSTHINKNWDLESYILQTRTMPENHTGENIAQGLKATMEEWNFNPKSPVYLKQENCSVVIFI